MQEIWVDLIGAEGLYKLSNNGILMSLSKTWICGQNTIRSKPDSIMSWANDENGYSIASVRINGKKKMISLHRQLAIHFIPNPENKPQINHKDGNTRNNNISNLEWATQSENTKHAYDTGLFRKRFEEESFNGKSVKITKKKTGEIFIFPTLTKAAKDMGIHITTISQNLNGNAKSWNYKFEYN